MKIKMEYIWIDGSTPTAKLRSKTKVFDWALLERQPKGIEDFPIWGFDGSSTEQATGWNSDCVLKPVFSCPNPLAPVGQHYLVLCEVLGTDMIPHVSNKRANLVKTAEKHKEKDMWFGLEQEYTFFKDGRPLGWPKAGFPAPQGGYYCGVGADEVFGRKIVEEHLDACLSARLEISGINAEVMPGQWEFQVGPLSPVKVSDQLWIARYLLYRIAEKHGVSVTLDPKPVKGDWNGAGCHTNFSTIAMRDERHRQGSATLRVPCLAYVESACEVLGLSANLNEAICLYGDGIAERLTGDHETCSYKEFRYGVSDRGASLRIPWQVVDDGKGYVEDRRPNANCDPYLVTEFLTRVICENE
jgi:glutamine synthetase